jgi:hypothetical protein
MDEPRHPVGPEIDDSGNPTVASPEEYDSSAGAAQDLNMGEPATGYSAEADAGPTPAAGSRPGEQSGEHPGGQPREAGRRPATGREMLAQLQQMIDTLAVQATPVMRDVAAKAAELAAVAGEKAGPLAHRAADATEKVGGRVAVRSKEMAAELRAAQARQGDAPAQPDATVEDEKADG